MFNKGYIVIALVAGFYIALYAVLFINDQTKPVLVWVHKGKPA